MIKKTKLYLLIIINLTAWSYVGYKVYRALQGGEGIELNDKKTDLRKIADEAAVEHITLSLKYPDPFLKSGDFSGELHHHQNKTSSNQTGPFQKVTVVNKQPKIQLPISSPTDIKYIGLLKNNDTGTQTAMMSINGKSVFVKTNDMIDGMTIKKIFKDSIIIKKGREKLVICKS